MCVLITVSGFSPRMVEDELELPSSLESAATKIEALDDSVLVGEAGKMGVLISLVDHLRQDGHRSLIFSQSRKILDIIQKVLRNQVGCLMDCRQVQTDQNCIIVTQECKS